MILFLLLDLDGPLAINLAFFSTLSNCAPQSADAALTYAMIGSKWFPRIKVSDVSPLDDHSRHRAFSEHE